MRFFVCLPRTEFLIVNHLLAETVIIYHYHSVVLIGIRIWFPISFQDLSLLSLSLETFLLLSFTFIERRKVQLEASLVAELVVKVPVISASVPKTID